MCDVCHDANTNCYHRCRLCGKDVCYECKHDWFEYSHELYCSGTFDGLYCPECDKRTDDELLNAYKQLAELRRRIDTIHDTIKAEATEVSRHIRTLLEAGNGEPSWRRST